MDRAVLERLVECAIDEAVLLDEREPDELRARHVDLEVVAAAGAIDDLDRPVRERGREQSVDLIGSHCVDGNAQLCPRLPLDAATVSDNELVARVSYLVSLPERAARALAAVVGGGLHESFELALPRMVRQSRFYEATARNLLRVTIELVGGVEPTNPIVDEYEPNPGKLAVRKGAGNVLELGSIFAFGFSPLWILAAAADVTHGSRAYLDTLVAELVNEGVLRAGTEFRSIDELLGALEGVSGTTARLIDIPPLETVALRRSLEDMRTDAAALPNADELARVYQAIRAAARREGTSMIDVSLGVGFAFFNSARHVGRQHLLDPYKEDLRPLRDEGFGAYARRVSRPYADAVARHFDGERTSHTESGIGRLRVGRKRSGRE